jgi:glycine cleavage system aminomethyltransferase T
MDSLRLEKGFLSLGTDLRAEYNPKEAGLAFTIDKSRDNYIGAAALSASNGAKTLATLLLDPDAPVPLGKEPILSNGAVAGYVSSANFGFTIRRPIALGYLPTELATPGAELSIEYFATPYPATVVKTPLLP